MQYGRRAEVDNRPISPNVADSPQPMEPPVSAGSPSTGAAGSIEPVSPAPSSQPSVSDPGQPSAPLPEPPSQTAEQPQEQSSTSSPDHLFTISRANDPFAGSSDEQSALQREIATSAPEEAVAQPQPEVVSQPDRKPVSFADIRSDKPPSHQSHPIPPTPALPSSPSVSPFDEKSPEDLVKEVLASEQNERRVLANKARSARKNENMNRIVSLAQSHSITNRDVRDVLISHKVLLLTI